MGIPTYFSVDGGNSGLADYDIFSDPADFDSDFDPTDPFAATYSSVTRQVLSPLDLQQLDVLGYHVKPLDVTTIRIVW